MKDEPPFKNLKFSSTPLYDLYHRLTENGIQLDLKTALSDPYILTSVPIKGKRYDLWLLEKIFRVKEQHNAIVSVYAPTAFYKSTFCLLEAMTYQNLFFKYGISKQKEWDARNIVYSPVELRNRVLELSANSDGNPIGTTLLIDEQPSSIHGRDLSYRIWSSDFEKQIRKLQINLYFASPSLESHVHHFIIHTYDWDKASRYIRAFVYTGDGTLIGSIILPMPTDDQIRKYNYIKSKHMLNLVTLQNKSLELETKIANELSSSPDFTIDLPDFPPTKFWSLTRDTQRYLVMQKYKIPTLSQANEIIRIALDMLITKYPDCEYLKRKSK